ncbi:hypothetical protein RhiirA1_450474 [Rhizophagus irregularis]|uniref:Uncharacterized protein n=1 Tax=Rhizophagus irregularis TaxID=588596 RepID=A0A2N0SEP0_9GLOM|nr:hypothetical protein RhiirA1_450474 [Rhizophagus irregularis]
MEYVDNGTLLFLTSILMNGCAKLGFTIVLPSTESNDAIYLFDIIPYIDPKSFRYK